MVRTEATRPDPLRPLDPLIGEWMAEGESPTGPYLCRRRFCRILGGRHVQLETHWEYVSSEFDELTIFGPDEIHGLQYTSFSSDGEQTSGYLSSAGGRSDAVVVFESLAPVSRLRYSYWPIVGLAEDSSTPWRRSPTSRPNDRSGEPTANVAAAVIAFVVESRSRTGWTRLLEHHYRAVVASDPADMTHQLADPEGDEHGDRSAEQDPQDRPGAV